MNFDDFIEKYNGKFVEYHSYGTGALNQCTDLVNQFIVEVLGLKAIIGTNAQDFPSKASSDYDWIINTPLGLPKKGDIVIFKSSDGVGHISVFISGNILYFTSFDQNYPTGSPCKKVSHNYRNVLGWLRPKKENMTDLSECLKAHNHLMGEIAVKDKQIKELTDQVNKQSIEIQELKEKNKDLQKQIDDHLCNSPEPAPELDPNWNAVVEQMKISNEILRSRG